MSIFRKSNNKQSSRRQININGVRDGVLLLPHNKYRAVLKVSAVNFEHKSEAEQDALIEIYQSFLNSIPCPLQVVLRIREMDLDKYLEAFTERIKKETKDIYKKQIESYSHFVKHLVSDNKILTRNFYVVIPFNSLEPIDFASAKEQLKLSSDIIIKGLERLNMRVSKLTSLEVLDLFYSFYNPEHAKTQSITNQTLSLLKQAYY